MSREQKKCLKEIKNFLDKFKEKRFSPDYDNYFYLAPYSTGVGNYLLKQISKINLNFFQKFYIISKDLISNIFQGKTKLVLNPNFKNFYYDKIIVTWAFQNQFSLTGNLSDRYLNTNSKETRNVLWFVIYMSKELPKKFGNNIVILYQDKKVNLAFFLSFFLRSFYNIKSNLSYFLSHHSTHSTFAKFFIRDFSNFIHSKIENILIMYEGQPFQNEIIKFIKQNKKNINTIGYIHSPPLGLPSNFIKKFYSPDKIIVNGSDQKHCFSKYLGWNKKNLYVKNSLRFIKNNRIIKNIIFMPLSFKSKTKILFFLKNLIEKEKINLKNFKIKIHPGSLTNKKHHQLKREMQKIISSSKKKNYKIPKNLSIFIGASGAIIEALEKKLNVYHICEDVITESFSKHIWKSIKEKKINPNIFSYKLNKFSNLIKFGNKKDNVNQYFKFKP